MTRSISDARTWLEYYEAHRDIYREIVMNRWALGAATFADHIHHTAIPDSSGAVLGIVNWAAYSQATPESLAEFGRVFRALLEREPVRKRTRYLLFTSSATSERSDWPSALSAIGADIWITDFQSALDLPAQWGPVDSLNALFGSEQELIWGRVEGHLDPVASMDALRRVRDVVRGSARLSERCVVPAQLRSLLVDSAIVMSAFRFGIPTKTLIESLTTSAGIAARIAAIRAEESDWTNEAQEYFQEVVDQAPSMVETYVVRPNDILSRIVRQRYALSFHHLWPLIRAINPGLDPDLIFPKQRIALPILDEYNSE